MFHRSSLFCIFVISFLKGFCNADIPLLTRLLQAPSPTSPSPPTPTSPSPPSPTLEIEPTYNPATAPSPSAPSPSQEFEPTYNPATAPSPSAPSPTSPTDGPAGGSESCDDSYVIKFRLTKDGQNIWRDCTWVARKSTNFRCNMDDAVTTTCPQSCGTCSTCVDSTARLRIEYKNRLMIRGCNWVGKKDTVRRCAIDGVDEACRVTCGVCA